MNVKGHTYSVVRHDGNGLPGVCLRVDTVFRVNVASLSGPSGSEQEKFTFVCRQRLMPSGAPRKKEQRVRH